MDTNALSSVESFREIFAHGLSGLLGDEKLGGIVLALANIKFAHHLVGNLSRGLEGPFKRVEDKYRALLSEGRPVADSEDDVLVFLKIVCIGLDRLGTTEHRNAGRWQLQFNHVRSFRPKRAAQEPVKAIRATFKREGFHFNKPFLQNECFWRGKNTGKDINLFYNKFPFVDFHALLVPDPLKEIEQFLSQEYHNFIWQFTAALAFQLPGVGFGYNSYGAFASVNHLHFQMFITEKPLPVSGSCWRHNGGRDEYPSRCEVFTSAANAWQYIDSLHKSETAYNLLYVPERIYCFPRRNQGTYQQAPWTSGFAWYEMSGGIITFNRQDFESLGEETVTQEFKAVTL